MKVAFGIEYDGSRFFGWQRQLNARTVQACVEEALSQIADAPLKVYCAGRTDTGVHASGQVIHIDTDVRRSLRSWMLGANANLPSDVSVVWAHAVDEDFHARFAATSRTYQYVICNRVARPGLWANKVSFVHHPLDTVSMVQAARCLIGEHDFSSFRAAGCQARHAIRAVRRIDIQRAEEFVIVTIEANAFVQHMVRNIIGTLLSVGDGRKSPVWVEQVLEARDRRAAGPTAPPDGLYLTVVAYPDRFCLPRPLASRPWSLRSPRDG
jgi:tRNA pseudouridine38-40 synthase